MRNDNHTPPVMIGLGEVLWDISPAGTTFGGAPANFAYMATVLGNRGIVASRVGKDSFGGKAREHMQRLGLTGAYIQDDPLHPTGSAEVQIDAHGQPTFTVREGVAWDYLEWTASWEELAAKAQVVCFGSLAQRSPISALTIERFLNSLPRSAVRICDINLREPFFDAKVVDRCLKLADIVKLNDFELHKIAELLGFGPGNERELVTQLIRAYPVKLLCLTRGSRGSLLLGEGQVVEHPGYQVTVADAIGAGDAFTACLVHHYLQGESLRVVSDLANRFASWVATKSGATPALNGTEVEDILRRRKPLSQHSP